MKKRVMVIGLMVAILFSCTTWAEPQEEGQSGEWNTERGVVTEPVTEPDLPDMPEETVNGQFDNSTFVAMEVPEEEQQQKRAEIEARMEQERDQRRQQFEQAMEDGVPYTDPNTPSLLDTNIGNFYPEPPFNDAIGGYTVLNGARLTINMEFEGWLDAYVDDITEQIDSCRGYNDSLYSTYIRRDSSTNEITTSSYQIYNPGNISGVYLQSVSYPESTFYPTGTGDVYVTESGWHKISLRYTVYEYEFSSFEDYYTYDLYVPVDVFVMGTEDYYADIWQVDGHVQDWFGQWLIEALKYDSRIINSYQEIDLCDLNLNYYPDLCGALGVYNKTVQNTDNSPKKLPGMIGHIGGNEVYISLSNTDIYGELPENLAIIKAGALELYFSANHITGHIPSSYKYIPLNVGYFEFHVENNQLTGTIPVFLSNSKYIEPWLYYNHNQFTDVELPSDSRSVADIVDLNHNFIPQGRIDALTEAYENYNIPVRCWGGENQYQLVAIEPGRTIDILTDMTVSPDFLKNYMQITLNGVEQDWIVASELVFGMVPGTGFDAIFTAQPDGSYLPSATGTAQAWVGFVQDKQGQAIAQSSALGAELTLNVQLTDDNNTVRKNVTEGEIFSVVVSGSSLTNIINKTFTVNYPASDLELLDAYAPTPLPDLMIGKVPGSNMNILTITPESLSFKLEPVMGSYTYWGGVATVLKFRAKRSIATTITLE